MTKDKPVKHRVIYCNCSHTQLVDEAAGREVLSALAASGLDIVAAADLCGLAALCPERLREAARAERLTVIACQGRAVRWLLRFAGVQLDGLNVEFVNMRAEKASAIVDRLLAGRPAQAAEARQWDLAPDGSWMPWFPVIDYDRCSTCKQCLSFCPFGVYELSPEGSVAVANPQNCKNNCPACARICPQGAIMFPKSADERTAGADVEAARPAAGAAELEKTLGSGDLHAILAERRRRLRGSMGAAGCGDNCDCRSTGRKKAKPPSGAPER